MNNTQLQNNIIAKLLAAENISVRRERVKLPYFDIKNRNLVLPQWKDMENELEHMLIAHEVGHAIFTGMDYVEGTKSLSFKCAMSYMNILEDVRIEKFMKRKFAGIKRTFSYGYKLLFDKDFFGHKQTNYREMILIDRINVHFKLGSYITVPFAEEEMVFVNRAENTETMEDIVSLAQDIYDFSAANPNPVFKHTDINYEYSDEDDDYYEDEFDDEFETEFDDSDDLINSDLGKNEENTGLDNDTDEDNNSNSNSENLSEQKDKSSEKKNTGNKASNVDEHSETNELSNPVTDSMLTENLSNYSDMVNVYKYWSFEKFIYDPIVPFKDIFWECSKNTYYDDLILNDKTHRDYVTKFKQETLINVNYLIKEFEMRKAATSYKNIRISKSGVLDTKKLYGYQISDNLFKSMTMTKDGKNHGMLFLLDWSGSMDTNMRKTLEQLINLVMFCQKAQIKYKVLAFSNYHNNKNIKKTHARQDYQSYGTEDGLIMANDAGLSLLELFSSEMSAHDMNKMIHYVLHTQFTGNMFSLGGTPLMESLIYMYDYIDTYLAKNHIEKFTFVTLTDGAGSPFNYNFNPTIRDDMGNVGKAQHRLICPHTKIEYKIRGYDVIKHTDMMCEMIKNRYKCNVIGFYLSDSGKYGIINIINAHYSGISKEEAEEKREQIKKDFAANSFSSLKDTGKDEMFIIPANKLKIDDSELEVSSDFTARKIAAKLTKNLNSRKTSRILLNNLINYVV